MAKNTSLLPALFSTLFLLFVSVGFTLGLGGLDKAGHATRYGILSDNQRVLTSERMKLQNLFRGELGITELSGRNDGIRVAEYLAYCGLPEGNPWCAAFVSWCFGQLGHNAPRNPWSPALFPKSRLIPLDQVQSGDIFSLFSASQGRIHHVGFVDHLQGKFLVTVEGNSENVVQSRRRPLSTIHSYANWL